MDYKKFNTYQVDQADCGIAAISTLIKFYGGYVNREKLREESGTTKLGTTLLGVFQTLSKYGVQAKAFSASTEVLKTITAPSILHVNLHNFNHFIIFFGYDVKRNAFKIYDPANKSLRCTYIKPTELDKIWESKAILKTDGVNSNFDQYRQPENALSLKRWIGQMIAPDENKLIAVLTLSIFIGIIAICTPVFLQLILDRIGKQEGTDLLTNISLVGALFLILLFKVGIVFLRDILIARQGLAFNNRLINNFFESILLLPKSFYDSKSTGDIIARMNDSNRIQKVLSLFSANILIDLMTIIFATIVVFNYSLPIGFILLGSIPVWALLLLRYNHKILRAQQATMGAYALSETRLVDSISGVIDIKIAQAERLFRKIIGATYGNYQKKNYDLKMVYAQFQLFTELLTTTLLSAVLVMLVYLFIQQEVTIGSIVAVFQLSMVLFSSLLSVGLGNIFLQEARVAFTRLHDYQALTKETTVSQEGTMIELSTPIEKVEYRNFSFHYPGRTDLIKSFDLKLEKGQIVCLLGENGSGKTTIAQALLQLITPSGGQILINDGILHQHLSTNSIRQRIGYLSQNVKIFNMSVIANICMREAEIATQEQMKIQSVLEELGLLNTFKSFTNGLSTIIGDGGIPVSGGQKQLIGIARLLLQDPDVLIFDEPTSALDSRSISRFFKLLNRIKKDKCVLLITHRPEVAQLADQIYVLSGKTNGRAGSPTMLFDNLTSQKSALALPLLHEI